MSVCQPFNNVKDFIALLQNRKCNFCRTANSSPTVSIISSFFNAHEYFEETYNSLKQQTFQDFEWIIVDDCSTDEKSIDLFASLTTKDFNIIKIQHEYNQGLSAGRNTAISYAVGKYLFFMDLDDLIEPTYIEKCVLFLEANPDFSLVNSYGVGFDSQEYWWSHGFEKSSKFIEQNWITAMLMYRKEDFNKLGGFDEKLRFYEDWERWLRAIVNGQKCWTIPEYLHCYRRRSSGLLLTSRKKIEEEKNVNNLIKTRYEHYFQTSDAQNYSLKRPSTFEVDLIRYKIEVTSKIHDEKCYAKRILFFFPWLEVGGADKFNIDLITLLANRGYGITIATTLKSQHPWHGYFYNFTSDIFHLPNFLHDAHWLAFTRYIIESRKIDIVFISNSYIAYYFLPLLRLEFPTVTFIDYTHCEDPGWRKCGYPRVSCQLNHFIDCQIVSSRHLENVYRKLNIDNTNKIRVCYINVDSKKWIHNQEKRNATRLRLGISDKTVLLLFPARLAPQKRPLFLVDIIKNLVNENLNISVITLGYGELLPQMQAKISQLGLEQVFYLLPPVKPEEMIDFYSAADILLLPSEYEGISLAIYEAMSMQLPVVASDVGGQSELVTPETGFLIPKGNGDEEEIQAYLEVLIPLIKDDVLRDKVGFSARQRIKEFFSLEAMGDRMESIFAEAIASHQAKPQIEINPDIAEEMLRLGLEYIHQEQVSSNLWHEKCQIEKERDALRIEKCQIEKERDALRSRKNAMETSKFWQMRKLWFKFKRKLGLTDEEL